MRVKVGNGLLLLNLMAGLLILAVSFLPSSVLSIVLGFPLMLIFPGYVVVLALFPRREAMNGVERGLLSCALSIAIVPSIGLILNYTAWGITLQTTLYSTVSFVLVMSLVAWFRWRRLPEPERFSIGFELKLPGAGGNSRSRALSIALLVSIVAAVGMLGYTIAKPRIGERFTEFYVLGLEGKAGGYPERLLVGETASVITGIVNREHEPTTYRVAVVVDGVSSSEVGPILLEDNDEWQTTIAFTPTRAGSNQRVEFLLYKNGESQVYLRLHFWVDVS